MKAAGQKKYNARYIIGQLYLRDYRFWAKGWVVSQVQ
jgi:hypothetical protein